MHTAYCVSAFREADIIYVLSSAHTSSSHSSDIFCIPSEYQHVHHLCAYSLSSVYTAKMDWDACIIIFGYNQDIANAAAILVTIPLLILVIKYLSPYVEKLKYESTTSLLPFLLLPLVYYIIEYAFTVYTDLLHTGGIVIIDFVDSFIVLLYLILSIFHLTPPTSEIRQSTKTSFSEPQQFRSKRRYSRYPTQRSRLPYTVMTCAII